MKLANCMPTIGTSSLPSCDILVNNQKRKLYGKNKNKVYLNDGDYIQLSIYNPTNQRIGLQLEFNGKKEENLLVINPFQRAVLDRFIDDKKKIQFNTYFVKDNDKRTEKEIKNNGKLKVSFWKEKVVYYAYPVTLCSSSSSGTGPYGMPGSSGEPYYGAGTLRGTTAGDITTTNSTVTTTFDTNFIREEERKNLGLKLKETGVIEKGEKSHQNLHETHFEKDHMFHEIKYKLLPFSERKPKLANFMESTPTPSAPVNVRTTYTDSYKNTSVDRRLYCTNCGYRIRNRSWKGCPMCLTPYC